GREHEPLGDGGAAEPLGEELKHLALALRQRAHLRSPPAVSLPCWGRTPWHGKMVTRSGSCLAGSRYFGSRLSSNGLRERLHAERPCGGMARHEGKRGGRGQSAAGSGGCRLRQVHDRPHPVNAERFTSEAEQLAPRSSRTSGRFAMLVVDDERRCLEANLSACQLLGLPRRSLI